MKLEKRSILILYGTETGNSQDFANLVLKQCRRYDIASCRVLGMDQVNLVDVVNSTIVIFVCSTTGQGELPRNAQRLWKQLLRRKLPPTLLSSVMFSSFGLGDSSYPKYNWAIRKIHQRLLQLGAKEIAKRGEGDDQDSEGMETHFDTWLDQLMTKMLEFLDIDATNGPDADKLLDPMFKIIIHRSKMKRATTSSSTKEIGMTRPNVITGLVQSNNRITTKDHFQDVRHLVFAAEKLSGTDYAPGDTVALYPSNDPDDVNALLQHHQHWMEIADYPIDVDHEFTKTVSGGLIKPLTVRSLLTHHLDITAIPRRSFFAGVWHFASDERESERLKEFSTLEGLQDLFDYANRPRRSILETITEFHSLKIPIEYILDLLPVLRPRLFSIASSPNQSIDIDRQIFELAVAVVRYKTIIRRVRRGVCTRWIEQLNTGDMIPFTVHKSSFKKPDCSVIMIATGTGIAPMRSLIHSHCLDLPMMRLFFGCRNRTKDYLFESEWTPLINSRKLEVNAAFSRDKNGGGYVQDQLFRSKQEVGALIIQGNCIVYLCGSSGAMPRQVRITLVEIIKETLQSNAEQAEQYLQEMEKTGRYIQETW
jgi:sulfite reductase alpha subunit-like flavoprotein